MAAARSPSASAAAPIPSASKQRWNGRNRAAGSRRVNGCCCIRMGLTEARNTNAREFGDAYLDAIVGWNGAAPAHALVQTVMEEWKTFTSTRPIEDDVSIAVIERR